MKIHLHTSNRKPLGFSLRETVTTVATLMTLATLASSSFSYFQNLTQKNETLYLVKSISHALEDYCYDYGYYPTADGKEGSSSEFYATLHGDIDGDGYTDPKSFNYLPSLNPHADGNASNTRSYNDYYIVIDSWENEILYRSPGVMNPSDDFDLWSHGADSEDKADDITNWRSTKTAANLNN